MSEQKTRALLPPEDPQPQQQAPPKPAATAAINLDDEDEGYIAQPKPPQQGQPSSAAPPPPSAAPPPSFDDDDEEGYVNPNKPKPQSQPQPVAAQTQTQPQQTTTTTTTNATSPSPQNQNPVKSKIPKDQQWQTKLIHDEAVDTKECLFGFFCFQCAQASAKADLDGSHVLYNCCCWHHGMTYSWLRNVFNIKSNCGSDMMAAVCCSCCAGRRILSEVRIRKAEGKINMVPSTAEVEKPEWIESFFGCSGCGIAQAIFCSCCQAHEARMFLQNPDELDCCFDVCCFNPCAVYGQVRHQYKIASTIGHPLFEDICVPLFCCPCALNRAVREARAYKNS